MKKILKYTIAKTGLGQFHLFLQSAIILILIANKNLNSWINTWNHFEKMPWLWKLSFLRQKAMSVIESVFSFLICAFLFELVRMNLAKINSWSILGAYGV